MMCDYVTFDISSLSENNNGSILNADPFLSRVEMGFRSHRCLGFPLPDIPEDEELVEQPTGISPLFCFDYELNIDKILRLAAWLYEDALAAAEVIHNPNRRAEAAAAATSRLDFATTNQRPAAAAADDDDTAVVLQQEHHRTYSLLDFLSLCVGSS